jgi:septal ring factor EnvC (AmiA/AmiB activator)
MIGRVCLGLLLVTALLAPGPLAAQGVPQADAASRGRMLIEVLDILERDLEVLGQQRRELSRTREDIEQKLARIYERSNRVEAELEKSSRQVEQMLRGLVLMKEPDDLLLLFATDRYQDLHVYKRLIRQITIRISRRLRLLVDEKKTLEMQRTELERENKSLASRRDALVKEIESVESVAQRARIELTRRNEQIVAIENLFMTATIDSPFVEPIPGRKIADGPRPPQSFSSMRGQKELLLPVSPGKLLKGFDELPTPPYGTEKMVRGWIVVPFASGKKKEATDTAYVRCPFPGIVVFVGEVPGFGLTLVVDHGHGFHTVYAALHKLQVAKGDPVDRDQLVGSIRTTPTGPELPYLYFELRQERIAIDPKPYFRLRPLAPEERVKTF